MSLRDELIQLYGGGKIAMVEQGHDFKSLCSRCQEIEGFEAERRRIHSFKARLEGLCREQTFDKQVEYCLKFLSGEKNEKNRTDFHALIKIAYWGNWSEAQREYFDKAYTIIEGNVYFFLSFTTRNNTPEEVNAVNQENRHFLQEVFLADKLSDVGDHSKENLLAKAIHRYLRNQGISGFYFPEHEGESNDVKAKLLDNIKNSMIFLQLIQGVMFDYKTPNYCHFEYKEAVKSEVCCKRIYIMGEQRADVLARKNIVNREWLPWFNEAVKKVDALQLIPTQFRCDEAIKENHDALKDKIVRQIERIRKDLFENIPA
ncbi:MAG: hypothetical protein GY841_03915 [FCB group bacterium]|nr:hypothetical protein [FCB group bacterium]